MRLRRRSSSTIRLSCLATLPAQLLDLLIHPQQHRDHRLTALLINRLGLGAAPRLRLRRGAFMSPTGLNDAN